MTVFQAWIFKGILVDNSRVASSLLEFLLTAANVARSERLAHLSEAPNIEIHNDAQQGLANEESLKCCNTAVRKNNQP